MDQQIGHLSPVAGRRSSADGSGVGVDKDLPALMATLEALHSALQIMKLAKKRLSGGSVTREELASFRVAEATAKESKAVLAQASPRMRHALKPFFAQREERRTLDRLRQASQVDLCFVIDATGSMAPVIDAVKTQIREIVQQLQACSRHIKIRLALVGYRDLTDGSAHFAITDFTSVSGFENALAGMRAKGGADECEDVIGGLEKALHLRWQQRTKVLLLCGDAPCHGSQYHHGCNDHYPGGTGTDVQPVLRKLRQLGVDITFLSMGNFDGAHDREIQRGMWRRPVHRQHVTGQSGPHEQHNGQRHGQRHAIHQLICKPG